MDHKRELTSIKLSQNFIAFQISCILFPAMFIFTNLLKISKKKKKKMKSLLFNEKAKVPGTNKLLFRWFLTWQ